jgi:von Willebrand factor type A domain
MQSIMKEWAARSPLTDPKSLAGSALFHVLLLLVASVAALGVSLPEGPEPSPVLRGQVDPVDNVAKTTPGEGGGNPGAIGFDQLAAALEPVAADSPREKESAAPTAPAEALLSEILPSRTATSEAVRQALPGPSTTLPGMAGSSGSGGGGGSGGGVGGGVGRGVGPGTEFFGARENATSFAYVIDCSGSMAMRGSLDVAKRELVSSLSRLPPDARFAVIFYNLSATVFTDPQGRRGLMEATASNKARVDAQLSQIEPFGGTEHMTALRAALALHPEVVFFLTDADLMTQSDAELIIGEAKKTRIQAVEFGRGLDLGGQSSPLRRLATATGGTYRYIDVTRFPQRAR